MSQKKIKDPMKLSKGKQIKFLKRENARLQRERELRSTRSDKQLVSPTADLCTDLTTP